MHSRVSVKERLDGAVTVDCPPIPQQHDGSAEVTEEISQEDLDICILKTVRPELHIEPDVPPAWRDAECAERRYSILFEPVVEMRGLAPRRPGPPDIGDE